MHDARLGLGKGVGSVATCVHLRKTRVAVAAAQANAELSEVAYGLVRLGSCGAAPAIATGSREHESALIHVAMGIASHRAAGHCEFGRVCATLWRTPLSRDVVPPSMFLRVSNCLGNQVDAVLPCAVWRSA
jgi:hypothetical protein